MPEDSIKVEVHSFVHADGVIKFEITVSTSQRIFRFKTINGMVDAQYSTRDGSKLTADQVMEVAVEVIDKYLLHIGYTVQSRKTFWNQLYANGSNHSLKQTHPPLVKGEAINELPSLRQRD